MRAALRSYPRQPPGAPLVALASHFNSLFGVRDACVFCLGEDMGLLFPHLLCLPLRVPFQSSSCSSLHRLASLTLDRFPS